MFENFILGSISRGRGPNHSNVDTQIVGDRAISGYIVVYRELFWRSHGEILNLKNKMLGRTRRTLRLCTLVEHIVPINRGANNIKHVVNK